MAVISCPAWPACLPACLPTCMAGLALGQIPHVAVRGVGRTSGGTSMLNKCKPLKTTKISGGVRVMKCCVNGSKRRGATTAAGICEKL